MISQNSMRGMAAVLLAATATSMASGRGWDYDFSSLRASYDDLTGELVIQSSIETYGTFSLGVGNPNITHTADFDAGHVGVGNLAAFEMRMTISNITGSTAVATSGSVMIRDLDGDSMGVDFNGLWDFDGNETSLNANSTSESIFVFDGDMAMEGTGNGGRWSMFYWANRPHYYFWDIDISGLDQHWFENGSFSDVAVGSTAIIAFPTPGALSVLGFGGLIGARRKRAS